MKKRVTWLAGISTLAAALLAGHVAHAADVGDDSEALADVRDGGDEAAGEHPTAKLTQRVETEGPIEVGGIVEIVLEIAHPPGAEVHFPETHSPQRWELVEATPGEVRGQEGRTTSIWNLQFGIYRPGKTTLEPFEVTVATAAGDEIVLQTEPAEIKVVSAFANLDEEATFTEPRPPVPVWVEDYTLAWVGGGAGALALLALLFLWAFRRQQMMPEPPPPPRKPHEIALEKLGAIAGDDLVERGEYMIFWVRLSEATREYLGRTHGFPPTELTTTEVLDQLRDVRWPPGLDLEDVERLLRRCDEVKFGGMVPTVEESSESLRRAFSIVELTRPRTDEPPSADDLLADGQSADGQSADDQSADDGTRDGPDADDEPDTDELEEARWAPPAEVDLPVEPMEEEE